MADTWDSDDPFVYDADGFVVGLKTAPPHHAALLATGWEGRESLSLLAASSPESFGADVLVYCRPGSSLRTFVLSETPPYVYRESRRDLTRRV